MVHKVVQLFSYHLICVVMAEKRQQVKKLLLTARFRVLSPEARAVKLIKEGVCGRKIAAHLCGLGEAQVRKLVLADCAGRQGGRNGRPALLERDIEDELVQWVQRRIDSGANPTRREFVEAVI